MYRMIIFFMLVLMACGYYAQTPDWEWVNVGTGTGSSVIMDVAVSETGYRYVTGRFSGNCTFGSLNVYGSELMGFVAGMDPSNTYQWLYPFELNTASGNNLSITIAADGFIYVTAYYSNSITIEGSVFTNAGQYDIVLLKLDTTGQLINCTTWGGAGYDYVFDIDSDDQGNVYLCGASTSPSLQFGQISFTPHASADAFVAKVNSSGSVDWVNQAWSSSGDYFYSIDVQGGEFCVSGVHSKAPSINFGSIQVISDYNWSSDYEVDGIVARGNNASGDWLWATDIENTQWNAYQCYVYDARFDSNNNVIVTGVFPGVIRVGDYILGPYGDNYGAHFIASFAPTGGANWARGIGSNSQSQFPDMSRISIDSSGNTFCTFTYTGTNNFGGTNLASLGGHDGFICKLNSSGTILWAKAVAGAGTETARCFLDVNDEPLIFGSFTSTPAYWDAYTAVATGGSEHAYIGKIDNTFPDFRVSAVSGYLPLTVSFTNKSTGCPTTYQWDFNGDGEVDSTDPNPIFTYTQPGTFTVSLTVSDGTHTRTKTQSDVINTILKPETDWLWAQSFGGIGTDKITDLVSDANGNIYVTGSFTDAVTINGTTHYSQGQSDIFVAKYDNTGQCLWFRPAGGNAEEDSYRIVYDNVSGLYICGYYVSSSLTFPGLTPLSGPGINSNYIMYAYAAKLDVEGNWLWCIGASSVNSHCEVNDLCVDTDGNLYLAGDYWHNIDFGVFSYSSSSYSYDGFIAKFSSTGSFLWSTNITGTNYQLVHSIAISPDNNVVITGQIIGLSTFGPGSFSLTPYGGIDVYVAKVSSGNGNWLWVRKGGGSGDDSSAWGGGISCSADGSIYVSVTVQSQLSYWGNLPVFNLNGSGQSACVAKLTSDGEWLWVHGSRLSTAVPENIAVTPDGYTYFTGSFQGRTFFDDYQLDSHGSDDVFLVKYTPQGNILWAMSAGGSGSDKGACVTLDNSGALFVGGYFNGSAIFQNTNLTSAGAQDGFITKVEVVKSDFVASVVSGRYPLIVNFTDLSVGVIESWAWDFNNDGTIDSNAQNPSWTYNQVGLYSVSLSVSSGSVIETQTKENYIHVYFFDSEFTSNITEGYVPLTVSFSDTTEGDILSREWDFNNDSVVDSRSSDPVWTYILPGYYTVRLSSSDINGSETEIKSDYIHATLNPAITHYVPGEHLTIQAAINASNDGDYIIVADGVYFENLLIEGKTITLASQFFTTGDSTHISNTIIDGSNAINPDQASALTILPSGGRPNSTPHIVGFTIRNGLGRRIIQNIGGSTIEKRVGGGVYIRQSNPRFSYNKIVDNDADDEGGGSYAFQGLPNHGGMIDPAIGLFNPGANYFANNTADLGADIYIYGVTNRDPLQIENCSFEVMSVADSQVSNYWVNSSAALSYQGCSGREAALTTDVYVASNGHDTLNSGISPASPFKTIDHALSRVYATEDNPLTIHIASGTYSPSLTGEKYPLQMVTHVSLQGEGTDETFLDAEANADFPRRVLNLDKVEGVTVSDLTVTGGFVTLAKNYNGGGIGIIGSSAILNKLLLAGSSSAGNGAGIYSFQSRVMADSIRVEYNAALGSGGGIYASESVLEITNSNVLNNSANKNGAGIALDSGSIQIEHNAFTNNQATGYQSKGGGISLTNSSGALIRDNQIKANNSDLGGGIYLQNNVELALDRNSISNNLADFNGGALFVNTTSGLFSNNLIANNTASQRGGGIYCYSAPQFINNTLVYNKANLQGGALYQNTGSPLHTNSIIWANVVGSSNTPNQVYLYAEDADPGFRYCNVQGGSAEFALSTGIAYNGVYSNNMDIDPLFIDPSEAAGSSFEIGEASFGLQDDSPCIDSGYPATDTGNFPLDLFANPRIDNSIIDIGAVEAVHYNGAMIALNPISIDFGRVNIHATPPTVQLTINNTGNQDLLIAGIDFELSPSAFSFTPIQGILVIVPGASLCLDITFSPSTIGNQTNRLIIQSNAINSPGYLLPLSGTAIDASTSYPSNVQLQVINNDVQLSWDPVVSDPQGNPYNPDYYIVLYNETPFTDSQYYYYLTYTPGLSVTHSGVALFRDQMFYRVLAVKLENRDSMALLSELENSKTALTWREVRQRLGLASKP